MIRSALCTFVFIIYNVYFSLFRPAKKDEIIYIYIYVYIYMCVCVCVCV